MIGDAWVWEGGAELIIINKITTKLGEKKLLARLGRPSVCVSLPQKLLENFRSTLSSRNEKKQATQQVRFSFY